MIQKQNNRFFRTSLVLVGLLLFSMAASAAVVEVYGIGSDRETALMDAQRTAVSTVMGQFIDGRSMVMNYNLVSDRILTSTQGFIKSYDILEEYSDPAGYRVRIRADVTLETIRDNINAIAVLQAAQGNPRFMVVPDPNPSVGAFDSSDPSVGEAIHGIQAYLSERQMNIVQGPTYAGDFVTGNADMLRNLSMFASDLGAEFAIYFSVVGKETGKSRTFFKATSTVDISIVHTGSYRIVAQVNGRAEGSDNTDPEFAFRKSAREAAKKAMAKALDMVLEDWSRTGTTAGTSFNLHIENIKGEDLEAFELLIGNSGAVNSATRRSYVSDKATFDVKVQGSLRDLGEAVGFVMQGEKWQWALVKSDGTSLTYRVPDKLEGAYIIIE